MKKVSSYDVTVDIDKGKIRFPNLCPACEKELHDNFTVKIQRSPKGFFGYLIWLLSGLYKISFPIHKECILKAKAASFHTLISFLLLILVFAIGTYLEVEGTILFIICVAILAITIILNLLKPPPLEFSKYGSTIDFTFNNLSYSMAFAEINDKLVVSASLGKISYVKDEGEKSTGKFQSIMIQAAILLSVIGLLVSTYFKMK
ncbi:MAG: hypothetical protein V2B20_23775 [Pseudomonadota bacterium]